jgi:hypothetical protein
VFTRNGIGNHQAKISKEKKPHMPKPEERKACHNISIALMQSVAKIRTEKPHIFFLFPYAMIATTIATIKH